MKQLHYMEISTHQNSNAFDEMFLSLPDEKQARLSRYRHEADRYAGTYSDILVRCLICMNSGMKYRDIEIRTAPAEKPYLASRPRCEFNISHTKGAIAAAVSDEPVGVDIEKIRDVDMAVARKVFSKGELDLLFSADDGRHIRFLEIWTKKEALLKCRGTGLTADLAAIDTARVLPGEKITTVWTGSYVISVCSRTEFEASDFKRITEADLYKLWRNFVC